ncbi:MAG: hypothetical protein WBE86_04510 [Candidatus Acidiferrales bacterium]
MNEAATKQAPAEMPEAEGRERSTIGFPYLDLDDSVEIAKAVYTLGGSTCQWDQLAAHLNAAANGGGFRARLQTAKMFGLLNYDRGTVTLTSLGARISDPAQERAARAESFLRIPLYNKVHEDFKNAVLPPPSGLETAMVNMGVSAKQKSKARQVFERSAKQSGFFEFGTTRLVMPSIKANASAATPAPIEEPEKPEKKNKPDLDEGRDPLIEGMLRQLPTPGSEWTTEDRRKWLEMASTIFNVIYKDSDDSRGSLKVIVEKSSAKQ